MYSENIKVFIYFVQIFEWFISKMSSPKVKTRQHAAEKVRFSSFRECHFSNEFSYMNKCWPALCAIKYTYSLQLVSMVNRDFFQICCTYNNNSQISSTHEKRCWTGQKISNQLCQDFLRLCYRIMMSWSMYGSPWHLKS